MKQIFRRLLTAQLTPKRAWLHLKRNESQGFGMSEGQIIITGASKGIGAAIAIELEKRGYLVICVSRSGEASGGQGYGLRYGG